MCVLWFTVWRQFFLQCSFFIVDLFISSLSTCILSVVGYM